MTKTCRIPTGTRIANAWFRTMGRLEVGKSYRHVLEVRGRKTGKPYSVPIDVMSSDGERWLVAPYGVVGWVRNARAPAR